MDQRECPVCGTIIEEPFAQLCELCSEEKSIFFYESNGCLYTSEFDDLEQVIQEELI
jgi:hypothetical protein